MTGKTHKAGGMLVSIVGFAILREKGLLLPDVNQFTMVSHLSITM